MLSQNYQPPHFQPEEGSLNDRVKGFWIYWDKYFQYTRNFLNQVDNSPVSAVASAGTITPLRQIQPISGAATIQTIALPSIFGDTVTLLSEGGFSLGTAGNIAAARTVTTGNAVTLYFNVRDSKWYPD